MKTSDNNGFPLKKIEDHYYSFRHKISDYFSDKNIINDGEFIFTQPADTNKPNSISFCESLKYCNLINKNAAVTCVITKKDFVDKFEKKLSVVIAKDPRNEFFLLHNHLCKTITGIPFFRHSIKKSAKIHQTAFVDKNCFIGDNVTISPGAIILNNSYINENAIIGPNVVIGSEALEFKRQSNGTLYKVAHMGGVYIGCDVEIMSNSVVSKDVYFGYTLIGGGTKIGPLCNISHRTNIGENCSIAGNTTIAGSAKVGNGVGIGPSVTVASGIEIGDHAEILLGSVVVKDVESYQKISGSFAMKHSMAMKIQAFLRSKGM